MLHISIAPEPPANTPSPRAAWRGRPRGSAARVRAARILLEAGRTAKPGRGTTQALTGDLEAPKPAKAALNGVLQRAAPANEPATAGKERPEPRGGRLRFTLSVLGNTVGGAVLLAGAFALPSVFATLASLLIA